MICKEALDWHGFQRNHKLWLYLLRKHGRTQLIYSTEHVFEIAGGIAWLLSHWLRDLLAGLVSITWKQKLQTLGSHPKRSIKPCYTNRTIKQTCKLTRPRTNLPESEHHAGFANWADELWKLATANIALHSVSMHSDGRTKP